MTNTIGYRGSDCAIAIDGTFAIRVQNFDVERRIPTTEVNEMGRFAPVGVIQDAYEYTARIVANTVENADLEDALAGTSDPTLEDYKDATGASIVGPYGGITGAKVMSIEYVATAGTGAMQTTIQLEGTGWTSGSIATPAVDTSVPAALVGKDVTVTIGDQVYRVQRATARATLARDRLAELGTTDTVGYGYDSPSVTGEIELVHSDYANPTLWNASTASPVDIVISCGGIKTITLTDCVSTGQPTSGAVRSWATVRYTYMSTDGGLTIA